MRMMPEEFHTWSQRLRFTPETEMLITSIRSSPPVRRVSGRSNNITGRYPSPKMGVSIQFESDRVEFWAIYTMERDDDVLEYYDQSSRIPLSYRAKSGRRTTQWHTPDFFVLRRESAGWEEWKPAQSLDTLAFPSLLAICTPNRWWHCPPGEAYAEQLGLTYRLRSSAEFHPLEIQNLKFYRISGRTRFLRSRSKKRWYWLIFRPILVFFSVNCLQSTRSCCRCHLDLAWHFVGPLPISQPLC